MLFAVDVRLLTGWNRVRIWGTSHAKVADGDDSYIPGD